MSIEAVPSELLLKIFLNTGPKSWLYSLPHVCRSWNHVVATIWNEVEHLECFLNWGRYDLTFTNGKTFTMGYAAAKHNVVGLLLVACGKSLKSLNLIGFPVLKEKTVLFIGETCKNLQKLLLNGELFSLASSLSIACQNLSRNLTEICLSNTMLKDNHPSNDMSPIIEAVLGICRNLHVVRIEACRCRAPHVEVFRLLEGLPLEKFNLNVNIGVPPAYAETIINYINCCSGNLKEIELKLDCFAGYADELRCQQLMTSLGTNKPIEVLKLCFGYTNPEFWANAFISPLINFRNLRQLMLQNFDFSVPVILPTLHQVAPNIMVLQLVYNLAITDSSFFKRWTAELPLLKTLEIVSGKISAECLAKFIITKCPRLISLFVKEINGLSYKHLALELHKHLHFCNNAAVADDALPTLSPLVIRLASLATGRNSCVDGEGLKSVKLCGLKTSDCDVIDSESRSFNCLRIEIERRCTRNRIE